MYQILEKKQVVYLILILLSISRLIFINADPSIFRSSDDIGDEFWWASAALIKSNSGIYPTGLFSGALAVGPAYTLILTYWFKIFGTELFTLRIISWLASVISAFTLYHIFKPSNKVNAAILAFGLSLLQMFVAYSSVAQIEMLQLSIFLIIIYSLKFTNYKALIFVGFLSAIAVLLKASFIIVVSAIAFYIIIKKKKECLREIIYFSIGFTLLILPYILFFFIPNYNFFQAYFIAFSNISFPFKVLLHPIGIPFRFIYFPQHLIFHDPTVALLIIFVIIRFIKKLNTESNASHKNINFDRLIIISALCFVFTIFTDFNERRMVLLIPAMSALLFIPYQIKNSLKPNLYLAVLYVLSLALIVQLRYYFGSIISITSLPEIFKDSAFWIVVHFFFFSLYAFLFLKYKSNFKRAFQYVFIIIFYTWVLQLVSKNFIYWGLSSFPLYYLQIIIFSILMLVALLYFKLKKYPILQCSWLIFAAFVLVFTFYKATYSIENMNDDFNSRFSEVNFIAGENSTFIATFPHSEKVLPFSGNFEDNPEALIEQFETYKPELFISSRRYGNKSIAFNDNLKSIEKELDCRFEPVWMYELLPNSISYKTDILVYRIVYQGNKKE